MLDKTSHGHLWDKVYFGDCLDIMRDLPDDSIDLIITSPPYADARKHTYGGVSPEEYVKWFSDRSEQMLRILKPTGSFVLNIKERAKDGERHTYVLDLILATKRDVGFRWVEEYMWHKTTAAPGKWKYRFRDSCIENIVADKRERHYRHKDKDCRKRFTVTTGTCMHATKRPLQDWIYAIYSVLTARKGVSALQLSKELGVQYRTAWHMLHRIREACGRGDFTLTTVVEVDETYIGGKEGNKHESKKLHAGRGAVGKTAVAGVRERGGKVKAQPVERTDARTLIGFVEGTVEPGATVYTDDAAAYGALPTIINQYAHDTVAHGKGEYVRGEAHTNGIESVWAVLKRSITGTWHHVSPKHLGRYVNEATFRLNEGNCEVDTLDRMTEFARGVGGKRLSYNNLIADNGLPAKVVPV